MPIAGGEQLRGVAFSEGLIVQRTTSAIPLLSRLKHTPEQKFEQVPHLPNSFFHLGQPKGLGDEASSALWLEARQRCWSSMLGFSDPVLGTVYNPREELMSAEALTKGISSSEYSSIKGALRWSKFGNI